MFTRYFEDCFQFSWLLAVLLCACYTPPVFSATGSDTESIKTGGVIALASHLPNYIILDPEQNVLKFQISVRKRLYQDHLYFAYTQESYWDLASKSLPFIESNYNPDIFWDVEHRGDETAGYHHRFGIEHESNGLDGINSRSWNRAYFKLDYAFEPDRARVGQAVIRQFLIEKRHNFSVKLWNGFEIAKENPDIEKYYGNFQLGYRFGDQKTGVGLSSRFAASGRWRSSQLDLLFMIPGSDIFSYVQVWNGYAESLLRFNQDVRIARLGFLFEL